jgi:hypothetical protein
MRLIIHSQETKEIHRCLVCHNIGGWLVNQRKPLEFECSKCGEKYTFDEWKELPTVTVPALSIPVIYQENLEEHR